MVTEVAADVLNHAQQSQRIALEDERVINERIEYLERRVTEFEESGDSSPGPGGVSYDVGHAF